MYFKSPWVGTLFYAGLSYYTKTWSRAACRDNIHTYSRRLVDLYTAVSHLLSRICCVSADHIVRPFINDTRGVLIDSPPDHPLRPNSNYLISYGRDVQYHLPNFQQRSPLHHRVFVSLACIVFDRVLLPEFCTLCRILCTLYTRYCIARFWTL